MLEALTSAGLGVSATASRTNAFIGIDGKTYWVKANVQQGLVAELIAGRLAAAVTAGPAAKIIRITSEALPGDGSANHLEGVVCGIEHLEGVVNSKDLGPLLARGEFAPGLIDAATRARSVVFQTWLGVGDQQVLVSLTNGRIFSIDHGDCFGNLTKPLPIDVVVAPIPGCDTKVGCDVALIDGAVSRIEAISDVDLERAVSQVPSGATWRAPADRRLAIGAWLATRRDGLREAMARWGI